MTVVTTQPGCPLQWVNIAVFLVGCCSPSSWCDMFFRQHDAQMDYYGTRLATCSSDRTVKIFDVRNGGQILVADLRGWDAYYYVVAGKPFCLMFLVFNSSLLTSLWVSLFFSFPTPLSPFCIHLSHPLSISLFLPFLSATRVLCGRWHGPTPCTETSWPLVPTTARSSSGKKRTAPGTRCTNTRDTSLQVGSCRSDGPSVFSTDHLAYCVLQ